MQLRIRQLKTSSYNRLCSSKNELEELKQGEAERTQAALAALMNEGKGLKYSSEPQDNLEKAQIHEEESLQESRKNLRQEMDQLHR